MRGTYTETQFLNSLQAAWKSYRLTGSCKLLLKLLAWPQRIHLLHPPPKPLTGPPRQQLESLGAFEHHSLSPTTTRNLEGPSKAVPGRSILFLRAIKLFLDGVLPGTLEWVNNWTSQCFTNMLILLSRHQSFSPCQVMEKPYHTDYRAIVT